MLSQRTQKRFMSQKEQILSIVGQEKSRIAKEILVTGLMEAAAHEADFESSVNLLASYCHPERTLRCCSAQAP